MFCDQLVSVIFNGADKYSTWLKFGNNSLCFVTKCTRAAKFHEVVLGESSKRWNTFVTKSVLLKLDVRQVHGFCCLMHWIKSL